MARQSRSISIRESLHKLFSPQLIRRIARDTGAVQRRRKVDPVALFWTLVLGFDDGDCRSIAGLRRTYAETTGKDLAPSSFYKRFTPALVAMLRFAVDHALQLGLEVGEALKGPMASFRGLILLDSTVLRLHDLLTPQYPGCRTTTAPAAAKIHLAYCVRGAGRTSIRLTPERTPDLRRVVIGPWARGQLFLFDLGYFSYELFASIQRRGGFFVTRLKRHVNLEIVSVQRGDRRHVRGTPFRRWLERSHAPWIDVTVAMPTRRCPSGRWSAHEHQPMRIVGRRQGDGGYELYLTNVSGEQLFAEDVPAVYAARWEVELVFKEWKSHYRLDDLPSRKPQVVEALLHASMLTLIVSRQLGNAIRARLDGEARRIRHHRWACVFQSFASSLLWIAVRSRRQSEPIERSLAAILVREARDPNVSRQHLLERVAQRTHARSVHPKNRNSYANLGP